MKNKMLTAIGHLFILLTVSLLAVAIFEVSWKPAAMALLSLFVGGYLWALGQESEDKP